MFIQKNVFRVQRRSRQKDAFGNCLNVFAVDQFASQSFNRGFNGLPASDITLLARAQSIVEYDMILSRLKEMKPDNAPSGLTDKQYLSRLIPNWVQWPSEIDHFMDYYNQLHPGTPLFEPHPDDSSKDSQPAGDASSDGETSQS